MDLKSRKSYTAAADPVYPDSGACVKKESN